MSPNPNNYTAQDPNDYVFVSKKNWARKHKVVSGGDSVGSLIGRPGPITGIILSLFDIIVSNVLKLLFYLLSIYTYAYEWINNWIFGAFDGIIPSNFKRGKVITLKFLRYTLTVLMPPFGVLLSKGLYGWFNVLICMIITYINFVGGIVYAFVITSRNRYADQYEAYQLKKDLDNNPESEATADVYALVSSVSFVLLLAIVIVLCIRYF